MENQKKKKVLLVSLNMHREYSLAIHYLKLFAEKNEEIKNSINIDILELGLSSILYEMMNKIMMKKPDIIGFSCNVWNIEKTLKLAKVVKLSLRIPIILGGQEVTNSYIDYLENPFIDIIVDGEGEETFTEIISDFIKTGLEYLKNIRGIQYRTPAGKFKNPKRPPIEDLNSIPSPYLSDNVPVTNEHHLGAMVELTRGCMNKCRFCFEACNFSSARFFSMDRVKKELESLVKKGIRRFHFLDPILANASPKRLKELSTILNSLFKDKTYFIPVEIYAEYITEKSIPYLNAFSVFDIGLQSASENVQKNIDRRFNLEKFTQGVKLLKKTGKEINIYLIMGLPGDNYFNFMKSIQYVTKLKPTCMFINHLCILNGTPLREDIEKYNIKFNPKPPYLILSNNTFSEKEINICKAFGRMCAKGYTLTTSLFRNHY